MTTPQRFRPVFALVLVASLALLPGCVAQMQEKLSALTGMSFAGTSASSKKSAQKATHTLSVKATPSDAKTTLLYFDESYRDGAALPRGLYVVEVSKPGYVTQREEVILDKDTTLSVALKTVEGYREESYEAMPVAGTFIWKKGKAFGELPFFIHEGKTFLRPDLEKQVSWREAWDYCRSLSTYGFSNWKLPSGDEYKALDYPTRQQLGKARFWTSDENRAFSYTGSVYKDDTPVPFSCMTKTVMSLDQLAAILAKDHSERMCGPFSEPEPVKPEPKAEKGEFEKTADYTKRLAKEKKEIDAAYKTATAEYAKRKANHAKACVALREAQKRPSFNTMYYDLAFHALNGDPVLESVVYNADAEHFDVVVAATRSKFKEKLTSKVRIKYAEEFKRNIAQSKETASIGMQVSGKDVSVAYVEELQNPEARLADAGYAAAKGNISALEAFVKRYPQAVQAKVAKEEIVRLKREAAVNAQRRAEESRRAAAAERERQDRLRRAYNKKKSVGESVCLDGKYLFFNMTIKGFVESTSGDRIQVRIHDTGGYSGDRYRRNSLIWDNYWSWRTCSY